MLLVCGHRLVACHETGHEVVHVVHHVGVLIDVHGVLVKLEAAPDLTHLSAHQRKLVADIVAHHHDVGSLGEVVLALGSIRLVHAVTQTIENLVCEVTLDLQSQLFVGNA